MDARTISCKDCDSDDDSEESDSSHNNEDINENVQVRAFYHTKCKDVKFISDESSVSVIFEMKAQLLNYLGQMDKSWSKMLARN